MPDKLCAALGAASLLVLTGCAAQAQDPAPSAAPSSASSAAAEGGSDPLLGAMLDTTQSVEGFRATVSVDGAAAQEAGGGLEIELLYSSVPEPTVQMTMPLGEALSEVLGDQVMLMRGEEVLMQTSPALGTDYEWLRVDLGAETDAGLVLQGYDPLAQVEALTAAGDLQEAGTEEIDGVTTTRYTGTFELDQALEAVAPERRAVIESMYPGQTEPVAFELFLDEENRPRRVVTDETTTMDFTEYGPVEIAYPEPAQIGDYDEVMAELQGG
ncbi:hypothetical protein [Allonocardiopsis opalescens]|uniref:Lipoprotein LprG n=1 Tax=Allonocardiopsis opalescens TaxID=1144618 RepID=A0A2T0Q854_9ACTN|nr:hypothetical protein [Allonocardiopsis opalescens]PRX99961.1 hypothetical protein CLV72_103572 [Allonocardiopsis opalescens]